VDGQYNSGLTTGVKLFQQTGTRTGEFFAGSGNGATNLAPTNQNPDRTYKPSSVLSQASASPNGMSPTTYTANRALNYYRQ
jgi:hypothetical protein